MADDAHYAASALLQVTRNMIYLEEGDTAELKQNALRIVGAGGTAQQAGKDRPIHQSTLCADDVELANHAHYMQKEIFEQPQALAQTLEMIAGAQALSPHIFGADAPALLNGTRVQYSNLDADLQAPSLDDNN